MAWCDINGQRNAAGLVNVFQLIMQDPTRSWLQSLTDDVKPDKQRLIAALKERIVDNEQNLKWTRQQELLGKNMRPTDSLESYVFKMDNLCFLLKKTEEVRVALFTYGLIPSLKSFVLSRVPITWRETVQAARLSAICVLPVT